MGHLYYATLGNLGFCTTNNAAPERCAQQTGFGLTNTDPFDNLQSNGYWSDLELAPGSSNAWFFSFSQGIQIDLIKSNNIFALAVRPGDVAAVPVPAAVWLMGSALLGLAGLRRKKAVT